MNLQKYYEEFKKNLCFINKTINLSHLNFDKKDSDVINFIIESSFLKMFIFWENFLEQSFVCYMEKKTCLKNPPNIYITPIDNDHAHKLLIGTQKYIDWANPEIVLTLASLYLENGQPYKDVINSIKPDLIDLKIIRNAVAHNSITVNRSFISLQKRKLQYWKQELSVAEFLMTTDSNSNTSMIEEFQRRLVSAAQIIISDSLM